MSYRCGFGGRQPYIECDGCGRLHHLNAARAPKWFLDGKPPPTWTGKRHSSTSREDYCPGCKPNPTGHAHQRGQG